MTPALTALVAAWYSVPPMLSRLAAVLVGALCAAVVFWFSLVYTVHRGILSVPDLRGLAIDEAGAAAHDLGLTMITVEPGVFSASTTPGTIAAQDPSPGFHVKTGSSIRVRVSLGGERVLVPAVVGESPQAAQRGIEEAGLVLAGRTRVEGQAVADSVVASDPLEGDPVAPGSAVSLLVNVTPTQPVWVMPTLLSRTQLAVEAFCRQHGLRVGQVHEVAYPGLPADLVLRQYPAAGSPLTRSDIITVWVSR